MKGANEALTEKNCTDAISREGLLKALEEIDNGTNMDIFTNEVRELINGQPKVKPVAAIASFSFNEKETRKIVHETVQEYLINPVNEIRAEIEEMPTDYCDGYTGLDKAEVLAVIDKHREDV